jgi:hypothetical protein
MVVVDLDTGSKQLSHQFGTTVVSLEIFFLKTAKSENLFLNNAFG